MNPMVIPAFFSKTLEVVVVVLWDFLFVLFACLLACSFQDFSHFFLSCFCYIYINFVISSLFFIYGSTVNLRGAPLLISFRKCSS